MIRQRLFNRLFNTRRVSLEVIRVELRHLIAIAALIRIFIGVSVDRSLLVAWTAHVRDPWSFTRYRGRYSSLYLRNRHKFVILDLIISFIVTRYIYHLFNRLRGVITRQIDLWDLLRRILRPFRTSSLLRNTILIFEFIDISRNSCMNTLKLGRILFYYPISLLLLDLTFVKI